MKTLVAVGRTGTTAHTIEIEHAFPLSEEWLQVNDAALVDESCQCDGSDDVMYACTYPPCVAESDADAAYYGAQFRAAASAGQEFADRVYDEKPYKYGGVL